MADCSRKKFGPERIRAGGRVVRCENRNPFFVTTGTGTHLNRLSDLDLQALVSDPWEISNCSKTSLTGQLTQ
jgi:hypothetical protein